MKLDAIDISKDTSFLFFSYYSSCFIYYFCIFGKLLSKSFLEPIEAAMLRKGDSESPSVPICIFELEL